MGVEQVFFLGGISAESLILCMIFCRLLIFFFQNQLLKKNVSGIPPECQTVWIQIRPDILSGLTCVLLILGELVNIKSYDLGKTRPDQAM